MHAVETRTTITRELVRTTPGIPATDGAGVEMTRIIGTPDLNMLDPFLLLDSFESDQPQDYIGGFPDHPHRGFETVTYLLEGRMRHKDSAGNEGVIEANGVQWMTAGKGIVHSEMPEQEDGLLMGFQLWVNLPKVDKMTEPAYQGFPVAEIPVEQRNNGTLVRVITGRTDEGAVGPVVNNFVKPTYLDITLSAGELFEQSLDSSDNAFIFVIEGNVNVGEQVRSLGKRRLGILSGGERVAVTAGNSDSRFLLVAGQPLNEPVARGGPFVMNTQQEVLQAFEDFRNNRF
ncbi:MAG TPA: quercetin 2,3-dioxygenase [Gammaproteobacteria bacterium]|nr:quercetin 2,3-dioxygenase [Gammaproteobacteria bacterium]